MPIDWDELDRIRDAETKLFSTTFPALSDVYVPGEGADESIAMIIGEAPGAQEEIRKRPFVGPAGIALRDLMGIAGLWNMPKDSLHGLQNAWLTNVMKFRPPRNRTPTQLEIDAAKPFLRREWQAIGATRLIITVGFTALYAVSGQKMSVLKVAGKVRYVHKKGGQRLILWPMIHPAFALRNEAARPLLEKDWERLGTWLETSGAKL